MSDKDEKGDKPEDFEKRYNDSQTHITKIEDENKALRDSQTKDKELFDTVSEYIDWDALNGTKKPDAEEDAGYVDKKTLNRTIKELKDTMTQNNTTNAFRVKYPDMVPYETLVGSYLGKTNSRDTMETRIDKAVELTRKLLESERVKGREEFEMEKKEKAAKKAEAAGLSGGKGAKGDEEEPEGESYDDYIKHRKSLGDKQWAPDKTFAKG